MSPAAPPGKTVPVFRHPRGRVHGGVEVLSSFCGGQSNSDQNCDVFLKEKISMQMSKLLLGHPVHGGNRLLSLHLAKQTMKISSAVTFPI